MDDRTIPEILDGLGQRHPREAWEHFLRGYAGIVLNVVRYFERDEDAVSDCFVYVCEKLASNHFHRLRKFNLRGPARFSTWLRAVVRNLCLDWHRQEFGRHRPFRAIQRTPVLDQQIFSKIYEEGLSAEEALHSLLPTFPSLDGEAVSAGIQRIETLLTARQKWLLAVRRAQVLPLESTLEELRAVVDVPDAAPGPEDVAITKDELDQLAHAVMQLPTGDRLLLSLRFEQGLSLQQIARIQGLETPQGADRRLHEVVARLRQIINRRMAERAAVCPCK